MIRLFFWQISVSVNAYTRDFYVENNSTYTVIKIPKQEQPLKVSEYSFIYMLILKENVAIKLTEGLTFCFSGKLLTHRQSRNIPLSTNDELFTDFSSYGTQRLFTHIKKSHVILLRMCFAISKHFV